MRDYRLDQPIPGETDEDRMVEGWKADTKSKLTRDPKHPQNDPKAEGSTIPWKTQPYHKKSPRH